MRQHRRSHISPIMTTLSVAVGLFLSSGCVSRSMTLPPPTPFTPVPVDFTHTWAEGAHPFTGAAVIDVEGDGTFEVFVGGGEGQRDALLSYRDGRLVNIEPGTGLSKNSATYGSTAIDLDADGDTDLLVAREDGVYLYLNDRGRFQERRIPVDLPVDSVPFAVAVSDIDHDGDGDLYISVFVNANTFRSATFNDPTHAKPNRLLLNNGDLTFTDITASSGTASKQNTFLSVFVDLDSDGWQDLVVSQNTGAVEIFRNMKDRTFQPITVSSVFGFWMGTAVGDIDKDGDQDLFFTNVGTSIPPFLTTGDLRKDQRHTHDWMLLRNDGNFHFTDVTEAYGLSGEGFAWGAVFEDLNLDGELDLLVAQNYIKWPVHKFLKLSGRTALQSTEHGMPVFSHSPALGLGNPYFGQAPVIVDLNGDGRQDLLWLNINGPARAFLNTARANYVTVTIPDTVAALGTRITLETGKGKSDTREVIGTIGMLTDQSPELSFGLGDNQQVVRAVIQYPDGQTEMIAAPPINTKLRLQRGPTMDTSVQ
ncbi:MAG: CRTAC1 family protein [Nitrospira sp.]|nr:CRTAC1 family protein [Nitrospira sp.]